MAGTLVPAIAFTGYRDAKIMMAHSIRIYWRFILSAENKEKNMLY